MTGSTEETVLISRSEIFNVWKSQNTTKEKNLAVIEFVKREITKNIRNENEKISISPEDERQIKNILSKLQLKWKKHSRSLARFLEAENSWLVQSLTISLPTNTTRNKNVKIGRSRKPFSELSVWSKRRNVSPLLESASPEELSFAASSSFYISGKRNIAKLINEISDPEKAKKLKRSCSSKDLQPIMYTPEEALALYIDGRFTKYSYTLMQREAKKHNANIYPTYKTIMQAKVSCYPDAQFIHITETLAEVNLQELVDHTARRLIMALEKTVLEKFNKNDEKEIIPLTLSLKWGCDGSSGHSEYKQRFTHHEDSDAFLFIVCTVPLQLTYENDTVVWQNPKSSSTRFCRPIKIILKQESQDLIKQEVKHIENKIQNLIPTKINFFSKEIIITFDFKLTMLDGKAFSAITDSSTQSCAICGATPKLMNNIDSILSRKCEVSRYDYGLSVLHAYIRCLECILHISYRLDIQKWQIRGEQEKIKYQERKKHVQNELKKQLGLLVDIPKPNYGTSNDGNTARRFFTNYEQVSNITGVDQHLIKRFNIILKTLSSGYIIDAEAFHKYAIETAKVYVNLYPWFDMPPSIHRILIHGSDIVKTVSLPIGMLSEEALEARNKDLRRFRQYNTRKCSRIAGITDLFHSLLFTSDPLISMISCKKNSLRSKKISFFEDEVKTLLVHPSHEVSTSDGEIEVEVE